MTNTSRPDHATCDMCKKRPHLRYANGAGDADKKWCDKNGLKSKTYRVLTAVHFRDTFCFAKSVDVRHTVEEISQFFAFFWRNVKIQ